MKKEKIKNIVLIIVVAVISSTITSFATSNYLFDSIDVKYDNSNGVQAETVQGAIDELYSCASDYSSVNNKIDGYFQNNPTSYFNGDSLNLGYNASSSYTTLRLYDSNSKVRGGFQYDSLLNSTKVIANDASGTVGQGTLELNGNPVKINGTNIGDYYKVTYTGFGTTTKAAIAAHGGGSFSNILTSMPSVTIPSGYTLVSHTYMELSGAVGVSCIFDSLSNANNTTNINGYIFNGSNSNISAGITLKINIISLWKKS